MDIITEEKLSQYFDVTRRAIQKVKISPDRNVDLEKAAREFLDTAKRYYEDAKYFSDKGDKVNAFAALSYAHGWLDAGARIGLFDVGHDNKLFSVD